MVARRGISDDSEDYAWLIWLSKVMHWNNMWLVNEPLPKHAYSNILKILPPKNENIQIKNSDIFHISAQNIDCGYLLELPH